MNVFYSMQEYSNEYKEELAPPSVLEEAKAYRKWNLLIAFAVMIVIVILYIMAANRAPYSDNIGVVVVPLVVLFLDAPAISILAGIVQAFRLRRAAHAQKKTMFAAFLATQPRVLLLLGCLGIVGVIWAAITFGPLALLLPLFPFWPVKFLF